MYKDLLSMADLTGTEVRDLIYSAVELKNSAIPIFWRAGPWPWSSSCPLFAQGPAST